MSSCPHHTRPCFALALAAVLAFSICSCQSPLQTPPPPSVRDLRNFQVTSAKERPQPTDSAGSQRDASPAAGPEDGHERRPNEGPSQHVGYPIIHNIGTTAIVRFEPGLPLEIQLDGQDLLDPAYRIGVQVEAVVPLRFPDDYKVVELSMDRALVSISKDATARFKAKDTLTVIITITRNGSRPGLIEARRELLTASPGTLTSEQRQVWTSGKMDESTAHALGRLVEIVDDPGLTRQIEMMVRKRAEDEKKATAYIAAYNRGMADQQFVNQVAEHDTQLSAFPNEEVISSASRAFVLYTPDAYRSEVIDHQIKVADFTAFPLPDEEARKLFGPFVADNFYALRLTMTNRMDTDQLVNLGMIRAYGRARVVPPPNHGSAFTKAIQVAPQSLQQIYTMTDAQRDHRSRAWTFRTLEFVGALASAIGPSFKVTNDFARASEIYSGTLVPGLKTLVPDTWAFYLLNIVNFGMPDLVKVPKGGSVDGKYLFFSKGKLQGQIQDPALTQGEVASDPKVVFLSFDTLQIPFERTTINPAPSVPAAPHATAKDRTVTVNWSSVTNATGYQLSRRDGAVGSFHPVAPLIPARQTSYTDRDCEAGTTYYYAVTATTADGATGTSELVSATTIPAGVAKPRGTATPTEVALIWDAISGVKGVDDAKYLVRRGDTENGAFNTVAETSDTAFSDTTVVDGSRYFYRLQAKNAAGTTAESKSFAITTPLEKPTFTPTASDSTVTLTWPKRDRVKTFHVRRRMGDGDAVEIGTAAGAATSYRDADKALRNGTTYEYTLTAENDLTQSAASDPVRATLKADATSNGASPGSAASSGTSSTVPASTSTTSAPP